MALQPLLLPIISMFRSLGIQQASSALRGLSGQFKNLSGQIGAAAGAFGAFSALQTASTFTIQAVEATQRFERNLLALNQVFEEVSPRMKLFAQEVENYGLSQSQAAQASVFLGSVLKQYGFTVTESAGQTERLVTLAQDLATTYGYDVQEALLAITALFRGEYDPIEKFGVAMKQNEVNARIAAEGLGDLEGAELANAQATARLTMLFERAGDSVGAFSRASDTLYGSQQRLTAVMGNLQVAAGAPLQQPLANINNIFADLAEEMGPQIVEIFEALGQAVNVLAPLIQALIRTAVNLIAPLQQIINLLTGILGPLISVVLMPALNLLNSALGMLNSLFDGISDQLAIVELRFKQFAASVEGTPLEGVIEGFQWFIDNGAGVGAVFDWLAGEFDKSAATARALAGEFPEIEMGARAASSALRRAGADAKEAEAAAEAVKALNDGLKAMATAADEASGKTSGLSQVFKDIEEAADKSEAEKKLQDLGVAAGLIEKVLTEPDWENIFKAITRYAQLAAIDISKVMSVTGAAMLANERAAIAEYLGGAFTVDGPTGARITDYVGDFYAKLDDEVEKQQARLRLSRMGASQGLIDSILNSAGWAEVYDRIIRDGETGLKRLQRSFNKTSEGAKELQDASEAASRAAQKLLDDEQAIADGIKRAFDEATEQANKFIETAAKAASISILPNTDEEIGRFTSAIRGSFRNIQSTLETGLSSRSIYRTAYNELSAYAEREFAILESIARQRDDIATRLDLATSLISEYRSVFTSALNLSNLLDNLGSSITERTVEEISTGIVRLDDGMRTLNVSIKRTFVETLENSQDQTGQLIDNFEQIRKKAVAFANNLRQLRDMGLDPMLFNQLVQAGIEAGGKTAQALVDGGTEAVDALNETYAELDAVGASLGESVAQTLYGSGLDMAQGIIDGLTNRENELYSLAQRMAESFSQSFKDAIGQATGEVVQGTANMAALQAELTTLRDKLDFAQMRLGQEQGNLSSAKDPERRAAIEKKIAAYSQQIKDFSDAISAITQQIGQIPQFAEGGIVNKATFAMVGEAGPEAIIPLSDMRAMMNSNGTKTVNNYNISVQVDATKSPAQVGQAIVQAINKFGNKGGQVATSFAGISTR